MTTGQTHVYGYHDRHAQYALPRESSICLLVLSDEDKVHSQSTLMSPRVHTIVVLSYKHA